MNKLYQLFFIITKSITNDSLITYGTSTEALLGACSEKKLPNTNQLFYSTKPILTFYIIVLSF